MGKLKLTLCLAVAGMASIASAETLYGDATWYSASSSSYYDTGVSDSLGLFFSGSSTGADLYSGWGTGSDWWSTSVSDYSSTSSSFYDSVSDYGSSGYSSSYDSYTSTFAYSASQTGSLYSSGSAWGDPFGTLTSVYAYGASYSDYSTSSYSTSDSWSNSWSTPSYENNGYSSTWSTAYYDQSSIWGYSGADNYLAGSYSEYYSGYGYSSLGYDQNSYASSYTSYGDSSSSWYGSWDASSYSNSYYSGSAFLYGGSYDYGYGYSDYSSYGFGFSSYGSYYQWLQPETIVNTIVEPIVGVPVVENLPNTANCQNGTGLAEACPPIVAEIINDPLPIPGSAVTATPEPGSFALLAAGLAGLYWRRRRQN